MKTTSTWHLLEHFKSKRNMLITFYCRTMGLVNTVNLRIEQKNVKGVRIQKLWCGGIRLQCIQLIPF